MSASLWLIHVHCYLLEIDIWKSVEHNLLSKYLLIQAVSPVFKQCDSLSIWDVSSPVTFTKLSTGTRLRRSLA